MTIIRIFETYESPFKSKRNISDFAEFLAEIM